MHPTRQKTNLQTKQHHLHTLCALSETTKDFKPEQLTSLINDAPSLQAAVQNVFNEISTDSPALERKWHQLIFELWSVHHPHLPDLLSLPIANEDVSDIIALQDALSYLAQLADQPVNLNREGDEWLLTTASTWRLATAFPSYQNRPLIKLENEWQYQTMRRQRAVLQALKLVRRQHDQLLVVKSRYAKFIELPPVQQYYLLWHTEAYHINWAFFSGFWSDYLHVIQKNLSLLWEIGQNSMPHLPQKLIQWNQEIYNSYAMLWTEAGLPTAHGGHHPDALSIIRLHSLPSAITQVIMNDVFGRYGLVCGEGDLYAWTNLGSQLITAESLEELPCSLDVLK